MLIYVAKRLAAAVATLLLIMTITFFLMNTIPGSPFLTEKSTPQQIELANQKYGLDKPLVVQLKNYLVNYMKGDLGVSLKMQEGTPVKNILFKQGKFGLSMRLGLLAVLVAVVLVGGMDYDAVVLRLYLLVQPKGMGGVVVYEDEAACTDE